MGKATASLVAGLLIFGAAGCSNSDDSPAPAESTTVPTSMRGTGVEMPPNGALSGSFGSAVLDGRAVDATFEPVRCSWDDEDGQPQLNFDAGSETTGGEVAVELVTSDPPRLDDFSIEAGGTEWESTDQQRMESHITVDGDKYRVTAQVTEDDGPRTAELAVAFTCAGE